MFDGPDGQVTLADLFDGRSQLIVYHFMLGPDWDEGCKSCSFWADNLQGIDVHLAARDVTLLTVSSAPLDRIGKFKTRMGWTHKWVSSAGSDFNRDYQVTFRAEELKNGEVYYNYTLDQILADRTAGDQRVLPGCGRHGVSHVFLLFARTRYVERCLPLSRPRSQRPR